MQTRATQGPDGRALSDRPYGERAKRIKEMAREVEADETGEAFKRVFKKMTVRKRAASRRYRA
jgi:hypothetical protein